MADMVVASPGRRSLLDRLEGRMAKWYRSHWEWSSDARRALLARARRLWNRGKIVARERAARDATPQASLTIPEDKGFALFPPGHFAEADEIVRAAQKAVEDSDLEAIIARARKSQLLSGFVNIQTLELDSPFLRFGLRPDVLAAVAKYLGVAPVLAGVDLMYSRHVAGSPQNSQLYHCDWDDTRQVKVFILCSDVTETHGPLVLLEAATSQRVREKLGYAYRNRAKDEEVAAHGGQGHTVSVVGKAGTIAFADTSRCFHYGSRVNGEAGPRMVMCLQYVTPSAFILPLNYGKAAPLRRLATRDMPALQRFALGAD